MDPETHDFYQNRAREWAAALPHEYSPELDGFLDRLAPGATILELGCGDGRDAERMLARGFDVHPTDGIEQMARLASERLKIHVPVLRFEDLEAVERFDAIWAHASLLHVERRELPAVLARVHRALKPGGWHFANFKGGSEGHRDQFGRYYNFMSGKGLHGAYEAAAIWPLLCFETTQGSSYGGQPTPWIAVTARK